VVLVASGPRTDAGQVSSQRRSSVHEPNEPSHMKILVTGGTGSFGRAFIGHCQKHHPEVTRLISLSRDEVKADQIGDQFKTYHQFRAYLGDVRDYHRLCQAFYGTDVVVHAAALKRVNAHTDGGELIKTNVIGTMNVVNACLACGVKQLVFISSDKAVEPMNQYGKTKASAEGFVIGSNAYNPDTFRASVVRYGNVLGSRGSVLQVWRKQQQAGERLQITDTEMTRFWMPLSAAVELVWEAIGRQSYQDGSTGGEIFVPSLKSASVYDLMRMVMRQTGDFKEPNVSVIGIRAGGEKVHEVLLSTEEVTRTLYDAASDLYIVPPSGPTWTEERWTGQAVPSTYRYTSNAPDRLMSEAELRTLMASADEQGY
jgi:UDP-N-acetylglucosamine 4,6-dehydratase